MTIHDTLDTTVFRARFPAFADTAAFPDLVLNADYALAGTFISQADSWTGGLSGAQLDNALQLLTAHIVQLMQDAANGDDSGPVLSAGIDKISVSVQAPPSRDGWSYWLSQTAYGKMLWALLSLLSVGGWSVGGRPESWAFRKVAGRFR